MPVPKERKERITLSTADWAAIERVFVQGTMDLKELSADGAVEYPGLKRPAYITLKNYARDHNWKDLRRAGRFQEYSADHASSLAIQDQVTQQAIAKTIEMVNASEVLQSHVNMAHRLRALAVDELEELIRGRLNTLDWDNLCAKDLIAIMNTWANMFKVSAQIEKEAVAMVNIDVAIQVCNLYGYRVEDPSASMTTTHTTHTTYAKAA